MLFMGSSGKSSIFSIMVASWGLSTWQGEVEVKGVGARVGGGGSK